MKALILAIAMLASALGAQTTGSFGPSCGGLLLNHVGTPKIGTFTFSTWCNANLDQTTGIHYLGVKRAPLAYSSVPCFMNVTPVVVSTFWKVGGAHIIAWAIPNNPALIGIRFDEQFFLWQPVNQEWHASNGGFFIVQA
jgi:hypothetical protein